MIGYATLGTNDLPRAAAFYDALLAELGAKRLWDYNRGIGWGVAPDKPSLGIMKPYDGNAATVGNGVMIALIVDSREKVDRVHRKALELGKDERPAGRAAKVSTRLFPRPGRKQVNVLLGLGIPPAPFAYRPRSDSSAPRDATLGRMRRHARPTPR
jgi:hypothetical protein